MDVLLVHPEIPQNTGCAARLTAATGTALHLVEPLGFSLEDRYLKRAGLDYWPLVDLVRAREPRRRRGALRRERGLRAPRAALHRPRPRRRGPLALRGRVRAPGTCSSSAASRRGLPRELLERHPERRVYIPIRPGVRSLNLASAVSLALYTALVRAGVPLPDNDGHHEPHPRATDDVWPHECARRPGPPGFPNG